MRRGAIVVALLVLAALTSTSGPSGDLVHTPCASLPSAMRAFVQPPGGSPRCAP